MIERANANVAAGVLPPMGRHHLQGRSRGARLAAACALVAGLGCGHGGEEPLARDAHDVPAPASEPRAELTMKVDLAPRRDCDEDFDLAMYKDPAVELIEWSGAPGSCSGRTVKLRYLSARITRERLITQIRTLCQRAEATP